jgi:predicted ester cyclase
MSNTDVVKAGHAAWSGSDWATMSSLLTDDFTLSGVTPQPLDKSAFLGLGHALLTAFPDWSFNASDYREEGDNVSLTTHVTGTHTGTLAAIPGAPSVPATGKQVALPAEQHVYTLRNGKLSSLKITTSPGGGVPSFYAQVGAPLG